MSGYDPSDLARLEAHYGELVREHGDGPEAAQWADRATQERRMMVLLDVAGATGARRPLSDARVLDLGCGTGHLFEVLRRTRQYRGEYLGVDIAEPALEAARRLHAPELGCAAPRFMRADILSAPLAEDFDYVFASGVFNNQLTDNWGFMQAILTAVWPNVRGALAFNALSTYVDWCEPHLFYADPERVFRFCKENLSPSVTLRHDYQIRPTAPPVEFSVYVSRVEHAPRVKQERAAT